MRGISLIFSLLLILAACEPALRTIPTSEYGNQDIQIQEQTDLCANILCLPGQICDQGTCVDVEEEISLEPEMCAYGEEWNGEECVCGEDRFWCPEQNKCISNGDCCVHSQCPRFNRCVPTHYRARLCADLPTGKLCRLLADNARTELIAVGNVDLRIIPSNWYNEGVEFTFNNEKVLITSQKTQYLNTDFYIENIEEVGGYCKEDED